MPSASVRTATVEKPRARQAVRTAKRRSESIDMVRRSAFGVLVLRFFGSALSAFSAFTLRHSRSVRLQPDRRRWSARLLAERRANTSPGRRALSGFFWGEVRRLARWGDCGRTEGGLQPGARRAERRPAGADRGLAVARFGERRAVGGIEKNRVVAEPAGAARL